MNATIESVAKVKKFEKREISTEIRSNDKEEEEEEEFQSLFLVREISAPDRGSRPESSVKGNDPLRPTYPPITFHPAIDLPPELRSFSGEPFAGSIPRFSWKKES